MPLKKLKIGVSACLLGMKYRYDGTDKLDARIVERLMNKVDFTSPRTAGTGSGVAVDAYTSAATGIGLSEGSVSSSWAGI